MAIALGNAFSADEGVSGAPRTISRSLTVQSADDYIVVGIGIWHSSTPIDVNSVTIDPGGANEASFTRSPNVSNPDVAAELWYLFGASVPPAGTYTVEASVDGRGIGWYGRALQGAAQQAPEATNTNSGNASSISVSVTTLTDGAYVFDIVAVDDQPSLSSDADQTDELNVQPGTAVSVGGSYEEEATAGSVTMGWTAGLSKTYAIAAAAIAPAGGGTATGSASDGMVLGDSTTEALIVPLDNDGLVLGDAATAQVAVVRPAAEDGLTLGDSASGFVSTVATTPTDGLTLGDAASVSVLELVELITYPAMHDEVKAYAALHDEVRVEAEFL